MISCKYGSCTEKYGIDLVRSACLAHLTFRNITAINHSLVYRIIMVGNYIHRRLFVRRICFGKLLTCLIINKFRFLPFQGPIWHSWYIVSIWKLSKPCKYPLQSIPFTLSYERLPLRPPPHHTVPGCIVSRRAHVICCAELKIIFQPEASEWPYVLGEWELAPRGEGQTSNHRPVLLLILLNGSKRWETLSHIKRQRPHFTRSAPRSQLPTAALQQELMDFVAFCSSVWPKHPEICMRASRLEDGEHDFGLNFPWLRWAKD